MSTPTVNTRHTLTGKLQRVTVGQAKVLKNVLEIVADDAKPFEPGMFKPGEVGEHKNPEPTPDAVAEAQAAYDLVLQDHSPNSNVAKAAKAVLVEAEAAAEEKRLAAEKANEQIQDGEEVTLEGLSDESATPEGDLQ